MSAPLRVIDIIDGTTVDGPGFRTSIYFAGCAHACEGCHNPQSWLFDSGRDMTAGELIDRIVANDMDVSLSGGDPVYQAEALLPLCRLIRQAGKTIWLYTGFRYEELLRLPLGRSLRRRWM